MNAGLMAVEGGSVAAFFYLWGMMGWKDFNQQKILNRYLRLAARGVAAFYVLLLLMTVLGSFRWIGTYPPWAFYREASSCVMLCGTASLGLWWFGVWPAGDAKLFILLACLYPLTNFIAPSDISRLFLVALINTFIPASVAVFFRAARYVFLTRLVHRRHFLLQLGWKKEMDFLAASVRDGLARVGPALGAAAELLRGAASHPVGALLKLARWMVSILSLSLFSYYLRDFFHSPLLFTLFWGVVFIVWRRLSAVIGVNYCRVFLAALGGALIFLRPPHWAELVKIVLNLSLFSFFFSMGIRWTMTVLAGNAGSAYVMTLLLPLFGAAAAWLMSAAAPALGRLSPGTLHSFVVLAAMGAFFGLSLVLVRLWDQEVLPSAIGEVSSFSVLAPGFIERLRQDEAFFEEHFSRLYADGLTAEQARALQEWCAREGVSMIPLTPTISFAAWIFLGFFLTRIMNGSNVLGYIF